MKFLCRLVGHNWGYRDERKIVGARIEVKYVGQYGDSPALTYITHIKTYRYTCSRCAKARTKEYDYDVNEEWAR